MHLNFSIFQTIVMADLIIQSLQPLLNIYSFVGVYSKKKKSKFEKIRSVILHFWSMLFVAFCCIPVIKNESAREDNNTMMFLVEAITACIKSLPLLIIDEKIKNLIDFFKHDRFAWRNNKEKKFLLECVKICHRNSEIYVTSLSAVTLGWFLQPILFKQRQFPVELWLPYSTDTNFAFYGTNFFILIGKC